MCKSEDEFILQNDESLLYHVTGLKFYQLETLEQSSLLFKICASRYFDWNHLPSGPYWVSTKNTVVSGVIDKVLEVYRDRVYVEIKFAITLANPEIYFPHSHVKNSNTKLKIFNLVLQISGGVFKKEADGSILIGKTEIELYMKATTDPVFDNNTSDLYCIDTVIQLPNGKIIGET